MITIKKGLDLPINGKPAQKITQAHPVTQVALVGPDYNGMMPTMAVAVGDRVKLGQEVFRDKKNPGVIYTAPGAGTVKEINRGDKRVLQSLVIELDGNEAVSFETCPLADFDRLSAEQIRTNLVASGLWTAFRTRPFSKVPHVGSSPSSIFVTAMDTDPFRVDPAVVLAEHSEAFNAGLNLLCKLTEGRVYLCKETDSNIPSGHNKKIFLAEFAGPHPAGLAGTHIHFLDPVHAHKTVWSINFQDVVAFAKLFETGKLFVERVVALGGAPVIMPRLLKTRLGANLNELTEGELRKGNNRVVSGSVFWGRNAVAPFNFLGRYHQNLSILAEGTERDFLGWLKPGMDKFSIKRVFQSALNPRATFDFTTSTGGSKRAMVPIGAFNAVMPLDIQPVHLLRNLIMGDTDTAQLLGALELDEEDLGLCTFVCTGKYEYGTILRKNLTLIEKEG
ncbi:MAG: NADH:ubiquinone reductase (Na(+)-transporting) subunit A [Candidatus Lambdaproteobacteria bacterium RIFOXYD1_FULL_56_27]|uniref:Na(+)-translocating NADH-quinone reductase subunit A n=1 Tax=Candidatus Lambdaproteobacteria bacterium RIFOXYD2_FULL_56_26 TaxID=1817773 RepID=A0A1F6GN47_9PROT|nr:MAG: NADH:ubiquinone reductase (Na(+)-transporting) subunit A [Candidatus Lambdaproteobacteria bacterium RIFOXYD2_FULL_56_26]OGH05554.1 MAG: NADH:ubiquinone reductase (Na(+)-transporting) subunit A [Candidatus Lambdaproteobacteria bacterium RIFOXYC1_FULL_56_13]OGH08513.1 MAG: NADH:ubiquinone reductase (Na(+)-transporting) subunit A [Candidatus Lambdaproteobacteria bacterium RIFOXYD1_FULL_56_27]